MGTTAVARRRELSLWPLALIPLVGALLIAGLYIVGSHFVDDVSSAGTEKQMLDSLEHDARAVTPPGMHEIALHRHPCGDIVDSFPTTVMRDLSPRAHAKWTTSRDALLTAYLRLGWRRDASAPGSSLERGDQTLVVEPADRWADTPPLRVEITDWSVPC